MSVRPLTVADRRYALIQRIFLSRKSTLAIYIAYGIKPPWIIAFTYLSRLKQFYRRAGVKWPWE